MQEYLCEAVEEVISWANRNQGFVTLLTFLLAILFGWITGIFKKLMYRTKFYVEIIQGPNLCSTFDTDRTLEGNRILRTAISAYIRVTNRGNAPSSIIKIRLAIHPASCRNPFHRIWLDQIITLDSFQYDFGDVADRVKLFPTLLQVDRKMLKSSRRYLLPGQSTNGVVYYEIGDSWGNFYPTRIKKHGITVTKVKICIEDSCGKKHKSNHEIPSVKISEARKFNKEFGNTLDKTISEAKGINTTA